MSSSHITDNVQRTVSVPKLYAPIEISKMLGVSMRTVRKWISGGELAHTRLSMSAHLIRVREDDLIAFLNRSYQPVQIPSDEQQDDRKSSD